jgi:DNA-binding response OmpR family regulator
MLDRPPRRPDAAVLAPYTIVVADDDHGWRTTLADSLREHGADVIEADDGTMLVGILRRAKVSLVITDLLMPRLTGGDVIGMLRFTGDTTPFLLVTGVPHLVRERARGWSRVSVVEKPLHLDALLDAVVEALAPRPFTAPR